VLTDFVMIDMHSEFNAIGKPERFTALVNKSNFHKILAVKKNENEFKKSKRSRMS
jgi:hypothetical protein